MKKLISVAFNDFRLVFRDSSLKIFIALPLLVLVVVRYVVPYVVSLYPMVGDYIPVILMLATMQGPTAFGFIYSMVLVDEKDTGVAKVYGVLPLSKFWFVVFRLIPPFLLAGLATFVLMVAQPFYGFTVVVSFAYSTLAALVAPLMTLFVALLATNKIEAMTWQKLFNLPLFLPIVAFFVGAPFSFVFAVFPTYWAYQGFSALIEGHASWGFLVTGFLYAIALVVLMIGRFTRTHFM